MHLKLTLMFILSSVALAETPQPQTPPPSPQGPQNIQPKQPKGTGYIAPFDDAVFDLQPKNPPPATTKGASGAEWYVAPDADENTEERQRKLDLCEASKDQSMKAFRDCFKAESKKATASRRLRQVEVENRKKKPVTNSPEGESVSEEKE